ncbi:MAG: hypothetical protein V3T05_08390 [Myxococcota bacterium]
MEALDVANPELRQIVDLGCGTPPGAAAWAVVGGRRPRVTGFAINAWAAAEARRTMEHWGSSG